MPPLSIRVSVRFRSLLRINRWSPPAFDYTRIFQFGLSLFLSFLFYFICRMAHFRTLKIKQHNRHTCNLTLDSEDFFHSSVLHRKEVIQPHLPIRLPCYDFTPVANPTFGSALLAVRLLTSGITGSHGVTGGVYKARERIHRSMLICDY